MTNVWNAAARGVGDAPHRSAPAGDADLDSAGSLARHLPASGHPQHRADALDVSVRSGRSLTSQGSTARGPARAHACEL